MSDRLVLAIPSKGRLKEQVESLLTANAMKLTLIGGERGYRASLEGAPDLDVQLMSASEIALQLAAGTIDAGITGLDLLRELDPSDRLGIEVIARLGIGRADMVLATPQAWIDVARIDDFDDVCAQFRRRHGRPLRIATKYLRFAGYILHERGVSDFRLVESLSATEAAPAAGIAEAIIDITTTGATLAANRLKTLADGLLLRSEAVLALAPGRRGLAAQEGLARIAAIGAA